MKITTFNPQIITKEPAPILELFEELGFEQRHKQEGVGSQGVTEIRMKDPNGFYLDVAVTEHIPGPDIPTMRMNVDNFWGSVSSMGSQYFLYSSFCLLSSHPNSR